MSHVTNIVVHVDWAHGEADTVLTTTPIPASRPFDQFLTKLGMDEAGGSKFFETDVYAAAVNYCDVDATVDTFVQMAAVLRDGCISIISQDYAQTIEVKDCVPIVHERWDT